MNHRSYSVDYSTMESVRPHDYMRSWSVCEDYTYSPPSSIHEDDIMPDPSAVYPQATSMADKCGYRTGKCFNMRAMKRNGKDHKLCDFHREKANQNQKKLDRKKRLKRFSPYETTSFTSNTKFDDPLASPTRIDQAPALLRVDELEFISNVMTTEEKLALEAAANSFFMSEDCPLDPSAELDMLFKSNVMYQVDQM